MSHARSEIIAVYSRFIECDEIPAHFVLFFFFFNDPATPEFYPLSLHDPLPILALVGDGGAAALERDRAAEEALEVRAAGLCIARVTGVAGEVLEELLARRGERAPDGPRAEPDRKSTRLNSSHSQISYAVFCLKT